MQLNAMVAPTVAKEIEAIAIFHHFTKSRAAELLVMRGLLAYQRDGLLVDLSEAPLSFKPQPPPGFITAHVTDLVIGENEAQPAAKRHSKKKIA